jgi:hypothetical protein
MAIFLVNLITISSGCIWNPPLMGLFSCDWCKKYWDEKAHVVTIKLNLSVLVKLTLLHAIDLSYFHNTCRRLMIWRCGWGKPLVTTKLLRLNLLMKILSTFWFYQASQHWFIGKWRHMVIEFSCRWWIQ